MLELVLMPRGIVVCEKTKPRTYFFSLRWTSSCWLPGIAGPVSQRLFLASRLSTEKRLCLLMADMFWMFWRRSTVICFDYIFDIVRLYNLYIWNYLNMFESNWIYVKYPILYAWEGTQDTRKYWEVGCLYPLQSRTKHHWTTAILLCFLAKPILSSPEHAYTSTIHTWYDATHPVRGYSFPTGWQFLNYLLQEKLLKMICECELCLSTPLNRRTG